MASRSSLRLGSRSAAAYRQIAFYTFKHALVQDAAYKASCAAAAPKSTLSIVDAMERDAETVARQPILLGLSLRASGV